MATGTLGKSLLLAACAVLTTSAAISGEPQGYGETRFVGEVSLIPRNYMGLWRIASRQITSDALTEIIAMRGPIIVGACVQVDMRREKVIKIETLRQDEC
ncbi:MAG: hypothetical protein R3E77_11755 [Steroidobacteraceae bacterium]